MVNKTILIGNLGADPEIRYTASKGTPVATLSVATGEVWKKEDGSKEEHTEWHRVVAFARLAEICREYLKKGSKVYIEGRLQTRKWTDRDGIDRYTTEIVVREMKMLTPKDGASRPEAPPRPGDDAPLPEPITMGDDVPF